MAEIRTLAELIDVSAEKYRDRPLFGTRGRTGWEWINYAEFRSEVERVRAAFFEMGMKNGDAAAIISGNSVPFALTVYAAYGLGAAIVPMYEVQKVEDWAYIIRDCGARFVFTGNEKIKGQIEALGIDGVERVMSYTAADGKKSEFEAMLEAHAEGMKRLEIDPEQIADILYTSGTTGKPKGVELTHRNIVQNTIYTHDGFDVSYRDRSLSFLPWAHAFGKTVELHIFPYFGASIALAESVRAIASNMKEVQPTILCGVPKVFNKFYDKIHQQAQKNAVSKKMFEITDDLSFKSNFGTLSKLESFGRKMIYRVIEPKIREAMGGRLRFCISGGAPLAIEIFNFFDAFGITIYEGYGMTETSPIIAVNKTGHIKPGSVGRVIGCDTVRIEPVESSPDGKSGEIIVSGDCVMKQYHNAPEITHTVLGAGHEFHTGDLGYFDEDGYLYLTGRVKEQYKLENGKYVVPAALEEKLNTSQAVEHAVIFGSGRPYNVVLIKPDHEYLARFVKEHHLETLKPEELAENDKLREALLAEVQRLGRDFRGYEKPAKISVILDEISIENGLLTPALKLRRHALEKKYAGKIDALYKS